MLVSGALEIQGFWLLPSATGGSISGDLGVLTLELGSSSSTLQNAKTQRKLQLPHNHSWSTRKLTPSELKPQGSPGGVPCGQVRGNSSSHRARAPWLLSKVFTHKTLIGGVLGLSFSSFLFHYFLCMFVWCAGMYMCVYMCACVNAQVCVMWTWESEVYVSCLPCSLCSLCVIAGLLT